MSRSPRPILPNASYFVTCVTHSRGRWFDKPEFAQIVVDQLKHYASAYHFLLAAYAVMPDHYHVVMNLTGEKTVSQILHAVNSYTVTLIARAAGSKMKPKVWQDHPWDEVIRDEDMYWQKIAYVLLNPWRASLVDDLLTVYPFSNLDEWLLREGKEFLLDLFSRYKRRSE